ncbi:MAG: ATP-dependent DNA helicase [Myxococcota bacterium]
MTDGEAAEGATEVAMAVKDVVAASLELPPPRRRYASAAGRLRAQLGHAAHDQARREAEAEGALTEVPVRLRRTCDASVVMVRGRADIVWDQDEDAGGRVVEEVKTTGAADGTLSELGARAAALQAALYALALHEENPRPTTLRVTVYSFASPSAPRVLTFPFEVETTERALARGIERLLAAHRAQRARGRRRRALAAGLGLPFPSPRPGQAEIIETTRDALARGRPVLIDAPTGTGKTAAALVPALKFALEREASVWFLTAKTTQRRLVAETFTAMMAARPPPPDEATTPPPSAPPVARAVVLRRKDAMCPPGHLRCHPRHCDLLARFEREGEDALARLRARPEPTLAPDVVFRFGQLEGVCPYELMHAAAREAELVVGDYHHGFDARSQRTHDTASLPRVVVVDEAHNLPDRVRRASSRAVWRASLRPLAEPRAPTPELGEAARRLARLVARGMAETVARATLEPRPSLDGRLVIALADGWVEVGRRAALLALRWSHARYTDGDAARDDPALDVMEELAHLGELVGRGDDTLVGYVCTEEAEEGVGIGIDCVDPGPTLERMHGRHVGTVMASATLHPLSFYLGELGLQRCDPVVTGATSPFPREHRCVCIVPTVDTRARERDAHHGQVADLVRETVGARPGNYAVFVPSFRYAEGLRPHLEACVAPGALVVQPPRASEALRARVLARLRAADRPTVLLAVAGGVFAEGVDLPGRALVGAVVVGPCLPAATFSRRLRQAWFDEHREGAGFAHAFAYPGMQRVIQAAGRVHRTEDDVGVVVLVGARFVDPVYIDAVPDLWWDHTVEELVTPSLTDRLTRFWRDHPEPTSDDEAFTRS